MQERDAGDAVTLEGKILTAVNKFLTTSPLINKVKLLVTRQSSTTSKDEDPEAAGASSSRSNSRSSSIASDIVSSIKSAFNDTLGSRHGVGKENGSGGSSNPSNDCKHAPDKSPELPKCPAIIEPQPEVEEKPVQKSRLNKYRQIPEKERRNSAISSSSNTSKNTNTEPLWIPQCQHEDIPDDPSVEEHMQISRLHKCCNSSGSDSTHNEQIRLPLCRHDIPDDDPNIEEHMQIPRLHKCCYVPGKDNTNIASGSGIGSSKTARKASLQTPHQPPRQPQAQSRQDDARLEAQETEEHMQIPRLHRCSHVTAEDEIASGPSGSSDTGNIDSKDVQEESPKRPRCPHDVEPDPNVEEHMQVPRLHRCCHTRRILKPEDVSSDGAVAGTSSSSNVYIRPPTHKITSIPATPDHLMANLALKKPHITKSQMKEFREAFRLFDKDGDGTITKEELRTVMHSLGQFARAEEINTMLEEIDIDGDGNVSFEEFVEIVSDVGGSGSSSSATDQEQEEQELRDAFRVFDKRNLGYITASDLRAVLQCLGEDLSEEEIEEMIKEVDVDGDGRIDFYEFAHALGEPGIDDEEDDDEEDYLTEDPKSLTEA